MLGKGLSGAPTLKELLERAAAHGQDVTEFVRQIIEKELQAPRTLDEVLAPVRKEFAESGMSDNELDTFFEEVRNEIWQEKHSKQGKTA